jgi:hypothetical protein
MQLCRTVTKPPLPYPGEDAEEEAARISALPDHESQTWLLLEYCDKPCLQVSASMQLCRCQTMAKAICTLLLGSSVSRQQ